MDKKEKKGRQDVIDFLRRCLKGSSSGVIERATLIIWLNNAERFDGEKKRRL